MWRSYVVGVVVTMCQSCGNRMTEFVFLLRLCMQYKLLCDDMWLNVIIKKSATHALCWIIFHACLKSFTRWSFLFLTIFTRVFKWSHWRRMNVLHSKITHSVNWQCGCGAVLLSFFRYREKLAMNSALMGVVVWYRIMSNTSPWI